MNELSARDYTLMLFSFYVHINLMQSTIPSVHNDGDTGDDEFSLCKITAMNVDHDEGF